MTDALILGSSPNRDGLTAACAAAVGEGLRSAGCQTVEVRLTEANVGRCVQCGDGWGTCRTDGVCQVADGFQALHGRAREARSIVLVTPVYWGDLSESAKAFVDRLRRCEALQRERSPLRGRWFMGVAAAGGGGGGTVSCLEQMERLVSHLGMRRWELIGVTRWTREASLDMIERSAAALAGALTAATDAARPPG